MNKCLVTKLKAKTNNTNLYKAGEIRFGIVGNSFGRIDLSTTTAGTVASVDGNSAFLVNGVSHSEYPLNVDLTQITPSRKFELSIVPKYDLSYIHSQSTFNYKGVLDFSLMNKLNKFIVSFDNESIIDIKLDNMNLYMETFELGGQNINFDTNGLIINGNNLRLPYTIAKQRTGIKGNIDTWKNIKNLQTFFIPFSGIEGSFSTLAKMNISNFGTAILGTNITGSIESFVEEKRKTTSSGSVQFSYLGDGGKITFQGQAIPNVSDNTISWTESTITLNDTSINA